MITPKKATSSRPFAESIKPLRDSEAFLSSVIENIPNMIFVKEAETLRFVSFNRAGEKLLGQRREDLIGKNDFDLFLREQAEFFVAKDREVLASGQQINIEEEIITVPSGGTRILKTQKMAIYGADGKPQYLLGISEDVTEHKELEAQRRQLNAEISARQIAESEAKRLKFLDSINKALTSSSNIQESVNSVSETLRNDFKCPVTINIFDLESLNNLDLLRLGSRFPLQQIQTLNPNEYEELLNAASIKAPSIEYTSASVSPLFLREHFYGLITVFNKNDQCRDKQALSFLDEITPRISLAIENAHLYTKAQAANDAKSDFLANVSHEVRTPLGAIIGFAELALEKAETHTFIADSLKTIARNGHQLLSLVNEVLDLSKIESKKMDIEMMPLSITTLLADVQTILCMKAQEKNIQLMFEKINMQSNLFISDPLRLRQILLNLIGNSLKFTCQGHIRLRVYEKVADSSHSDVFFELQDTGIGMSPEQQSKLFSAFQQGDCSTTRRYGGTGLGLFISRKLAQLLGGELNLIKSAPGEGSTFLLKLRLEIAQNLVEKTNLEESKNSKSTQLTLTQPIDDILVVDDSSENRILMDAYLSRLNIQHDLVENGAKALDKMREKNYSVVFMDVQMPEMDGMTALKQARKHGYTGKVVALTAHAMKGDREHCIKEGFDDYLCKPISRKTLESFLQSQGESLH
jgi:two-component system, sensor histidine kinase